MGYVYHGSRKKLNILKPTLSGFGKKYVYATTSPILAAIFCKGIGGSFVAGWKKIGKKVYFIERKKGIFNKWYANKKGFVYVLNKKYFKHKRFLKNYELVSEKPVKPIKIIEINNLKKYFLDLEKKGKFKLIKFSEMLRYFPNDDKKIIKQCLDFIACYGRGGKSIIKKLQPRLYNKVIEELKKEHKKGEYWKKYHKEIQEIKNKLKKIKKK